MPPNISVILPTNKINTNDELNKIIHVSHIAIKERAINEEFSNLCNWYISPSDEDEITHILEPTLESLMCQKFDGYEVLLCHRYPEDIKDKIDRYHELNKHKDFNFDIKLIREKSSIWHNLGDEYRTVNNIRNTGLLYAQGELILFLDDYTIFSENLLQNAWDAYKDGYYITARGIRRIRYEPSAKSENKIIGKGSIVDKGIYGSRNFNNLDDGTLLPKSATWTYCCSVSLEDCLSINGFEECYDGNFGGTDQDFGRRLERISLFKRKLSGTIYEFAHKSPRQKIRDDEMFRGIIGQSPNPKHIKANSWKPAKEDLGRYKTWHIRTHGYIDKNWNAFMDIPLFDLRELRKEIW